MYLRRAGDTGIRGHHHCDDDDGESNDDRGHQGNAARHRGGTCFSAVKTSLPRFGLAACMAGLLCLLVYFKVTVHRRKAAFLATVSRLETSISGLESDAKLMAEELTARQKELSAKQQEGTQKDEQIGKLQKKVASYGAVQDRLSQDNLIKALQLQSGIFCRLRWGDGPAHVLLETAEGDIEIEMAPFNLMPHTVHYFLTLVETGYWNGCHVIRNAGHVMQLNCNYRQPRHADHPSVVFQEFTKEYHHDPFTVGLAGRPGGVDWYISLVDNRAAHGPGGQGPEADPCFGRVLAGHEWITAVHKKLSKEWLPTEELIEIRRASIIAKGGPQEAPRNAAAEQQFLQTQP